VPHGSYVVLLGTLVHAVPGELEKAAECYGAALKGQAPPRRITQTVGADEVAIVWECLKDHLPKARAKRAAKAKAAAAPKRPRLPSRAEREADLKAREADLAAIAACNTAALLRTDLQHAEADLQDAQRELKASRHLQDKAFDTVLSAEGEQEWRDTQIAALEEQVAARPTLDSLATPFRQRVQQALTPGTKDAINGLLRGEVDGEVDGRAPAWGCAVQ
jgi:hypothetical protein